MGSPQYERVQFFQPQSLTERISVLRTSGNETGGHIEEVTPLNLTTDDEMIEYDFNRNFRDPTLSKMTFPRMILLSTLAVIAIAISILVPSIILQSSAWCGNGVVEVGEFCDDMNTDDTDGCTPACKISGGFYCWSWHDGRSFHFFLNFD
jgi:cysteine-rich repeat protein